MARKKAQPSVEEEVNVEAEIPEEEKTAVSDLLARIARAKTLTKHFYNQTLPDNRRYAWGGKRSTVEQIQEQDESRTRTNLIHATLATLMPHIYAKNPEIAVTPTESVAEVEYTKIKQFGKTCEVMLDRCFVREGQLKKRAKSNVRSAMTTSVGWIKMQLQKSLAGDPIIIRRVNDLQDNLQRIEYLIRQSKKDVDLVQMQRQRQELTQQIAAIHSGTEVKTYKGFVLDRVQTEDMLILDEAVVDFDDYVTAKKLAHGVWMTDDEYKQIYGAEPGPSATKFSQPTSGDHAVDTGNKIEFAAGDAKDEFRRVWEVWDRTQNTVYTVAEGGKRWCRAPYRPQSTPERWHGFFCLGFNLVEGRWRPLSDVELLKKLQDEYNTTRYLFAETRKESIPTRVFRKGGNLSEEDIKALKDRRSREWIGVEGNPQVPLAQDIMQFDGIKIDAEAFDVTIIRNDMDMLVGLSDASRANLIQAKTATEAEIMRQALMNRVAERQDTNEDFISEMAIAALQIMLREFTVDEVKQIAGDQAVWPEQPNSADEIFHKVNIQVRAGSTGKPNILKEREQWTQLMPVLNDTITQVAELRATGHFDMAVSKIELLKETLRRYDERIDVDSFIPRMSKDDQKMQEQQQLAKAQQAIEQAKLLQEELVKTKEALAKTEQALQIAKQNDQAKAAEQNAKTVEAQAKAAVETARESSRVEQERLKTNEAVAEAQAKKELDIRLAELDRDNKVALAQVQEEQETIREEKRLASAERIAELNIAAKNELAKEQAKAKAEAAAAPQAGGGVARRRDDVNKLVAEAVRAAKIVQVQDYVRNSKGELTGIKAKRGDGSVSNIPIKVH